MSYLPRMSKTYKEPQKMVIDEAPLITFNNLPPASSLVNEKTLNPQTILKHYHYFVHAPPVLPGPSVLAQASLTEQVQQNLKSKKKNIEEKLVEEDKVPTPPQKSPLKHDDIAETPMEVEEPNLETSSTKSESPTPPPSRRTSSLKSTKTVVAKKKPVKKEVTKKKEDPKYKNLDSIMEVSEMSVEKPAKLEIREEKKPVSVPTIPKNKKHKGKKAETSPLASRRSTKPSPTASVELSPRGSKSPRTRRISDISENSAEPSPSMESVITTNDFAVQCEPISGSYKVAVVPSPIRTLFRTLSFLLQKVSKDTVEKDYSQETKKLLLQIEMNLASMCNYENDRGYLLEIFQVDPKRIRDITRDVKFYLKRYFGESAKVSAMLNDKKNLSRDIAEKNYEIAFLQEKLDDVELKKLYLPDMDGSDIKMPEVNLQNTMLENEQLRAEVEIDDIEMKKIRRSLGESDLYIKNFVEEITKMKRKLSSIKAKSKSETSAGKTSKSDVKEVGPGRKKKNK